MKKDIIDTTGKYLAVLVAVLFGVLLVGVTSAILYGLYKLLV